MAVDDRDELSEEEQKLELLFAQVKFNRRMLIILSVFGAIMVSVLLTSTIIFSVRISSPIQVPKQAFATQLKEINVQLDHLIEMHNQRSLSYSDFDRQLNVIRSSFSDERLQVYRELLIEREQMQRDILS